MFYSDDGEYIILKIKAQPNASRSEFCGLYGEDALKVRVAAAAVEGAANRELRKFIAKTFKVPKSSVATISGESSKIHTIRLPKSKELEDFIEEVKSER